VQLLVTNDDGVSAPGLHALAGALVRAGHRVVVAAPARDCSGQSASIGPVHLSGQVAFERVEIDGLAAETLAIDGPPALAVMAACLGGFGPLPDLVVAGINAGANTGRAVLHSGTVGAALTAANFGIPGLAVSQAGRSDYHWAAAAAWAVALLDEAVALDRPAVLNLNVPNRDMPDIQGLRPATLEPGGVVQSGVIEQPSGGVLELNFRRMADPAEGSDTALLEQGWATLTAVVGPASADVDVTQACRRVGRSMAQLPHRRIPA
jgi:5'-nucleotidase